MSKHENALHEMNPTGRFSDRAVDYAKFRPSYPAAAIDAVLHGSPRPQTWLAADIGAGTGISSRLLGDRGVRVIAIEPNAAMRAAALPHRWIEWRGGTAEATGLAAESIDLVLSAQAFHWFKPVAAVAELHRILRPHGRLALMWNSRDQRDELTRGYVEAIRAVNGESIVERAPFDRAVIHRHGHFTPARLLTFENQQELGAEGLIGRSISASYVPKHGPAFEQLRQHLLALHDRFRDERGMVRLKYVTKVYISERR